MSAPPAPGPEVDAKEDLWRCITTPDWWVAEQKRPSSAAFKRPDFSTDIASIAETASYTLCRFPTGCGLVSFNCGAARTIGFVARKEEDPDHPTNQAHANVYNPITSGSKRKTMAQKLAQWVVDNGGVLAEPNFPPSS